MSRSSYILHPVFLKLIKQKFFFSFLSLKIKIYCRPSDGQMLQMSLHGVEGQRPLD